MTNIYSKTETDNLLASKQATLTAGTSLLGVGSAISALDYNKITLNLPSTFPPTMTNIYSKTETDNLLAFKQATLTAGTTLLGNGGSITAINWNNITTNKPTNFQADWNTTVINKPDLSAYLTTSTANTTYLRLDGSASMTSKLLLLTGGNGNPSFATVNGGTGDRIVFASGVAGSVLPYSIGYSLNNLWISAPNTATINTYIDGSIKWSVGSTGGILYGILNATTLQEGGTNLDAKYTTNVALNSCNFLTSTSLNNYVSKTGDTMSGALTVNNNINISNSLIFDNSYNLKKIQLNSTNAIGSDGNTMYLYTAGTFTFKNGNTTVYSVDSAGSMSTNGTIYPAGGLNSTGTVTANSVVANSFTEGGVLLSNKYITSAALDTTYLRLNGANSMTGNLGIGNTNPTCRLSVNPNPVYNGVFDFATCPCVITNPTPSSASALNDPQPVLHLCREGTLLQSYGQRISFYLSRYENNALNSRTRCDIVLAENEFLNRTVMTLLSNGNVGIGTTNPTSKLCINPNPVHSGAFNFTTSPCVITNSTPSSATVLNDPQPVLHLCREGTNAQTYGQRISFYLSRYENNGINSRTRCDIVLAESMFQNITVMTLLSNGNVNIPTSLSINGNQIYDYLFNSTGNTHASTGDYNVSSFGCRFILGTTNQPSVTYGSQNSSYTIYMGLGIEYPASQYGCQIAIPRNVGNPTLSVRFKEANNWGGWSAITAGVALSLNGTATFTVNTWHRSSDNQQRFYFENNTTTYIQGQGTNPIIFRNNANSDIAVIDSNGKMTLKTININGPDGFTLRINGTANYWNIYTGTTPTTLKTNSLIFFHGASGIASNWWLDGTQTNTNADISDKRSKYNIEDFTALETIEKLKPKSFDIIDDKDLKFQYGFIAQDIEEIPEVAKLVFTEPDYVANVNTYGKRVNDGEGCIITANNDLSGKIEVGDELKFVSDNKDKDSQEFILDATPYHNRYKRRYAKITEIISPTQFKVDCEINNLCCLDDDEFLIYGKKVEDAKRLDYNSFIALNTKAIQELYKIIQQQQEQINLLLSNRNVDK